MKLTGTAHLGNYVTLKLTETAHLSDYVTLKLVEATLLRLTLGIKLFLAVELLPPKILALIVGSDACIVAKLVTLGIADNTPDTEGGLAPNATMIPLIKAKITANSIKKGA